MSYTKNTWTNGDTITAEKLNNMENGIANAGGTMIVTINYENGSQTLDKTWQEIHDALAAGFRGIIIVSDPNYSAVMQNTIDEAYIDGGDGYYYISGASIEDYHTDSPSGYPSYIDPNSLVN